MIMPCGSRSSRIRKHFALNSVAVNVFSLIFMALIGSQMTGYTTSQILSDPRANTRLADLQESKS
jgi:hypothetical protein